MCVQKEILQSKGKKPFKLKKKKALYVHIYNQHFWSHFEEIVINVRKLDGTEILLWKDTHDTPPPLFTFAGILTVLRK